MKHINECPEPGCRELRKYRGQQRQSDTVQLVAFLCDEGHHTNEQIDVGSVPEFDDDGIAESPKSPLDELPVTRTIW